MDLTVRTKDYSLDDNSWLDSERGTNAGKPVTLDLTAFNAAQYANGFIPSGCVLGVITADDTYGPYDATATDGREVAAGFLYGGVPVNAGSTIAGGTILREGEVKTNRLPFQTGQAGRGYLDAGAQTDLAGHFLFRTA